MARAVRRAAASLGWVRSISGRGPRQDILGDGGFFIQWENGRESKASTTGIFGPNGMLNEFPTQSGQSSTVWSGLRTPAFPIPSGLSRSDRPMRITSFALLLLPLLAASPARAELHITRDHGGYVQGYEGKVQAHPGSPRAGDHRRHLQFRLHAGVRHRADEQDLRDPARQPRLPRPITTRPSPSASRSRARKGRRT